MQRYLGTIKKATIYGSYKQHMLEHTNLGEYCKTGMRTKQKKFIVHFLKMIDEKENLILNQVCQQLMTCFFVAMEPATQFAESNLKSFF